MPTRNVLVTTTNKDEAVFTIDTDWGAGGYTVNSVGHLTILGDVKANGNHDVQAIFAAGQWVSVHVAGSRFDLDESEYEAATD